MADKVEPRPLPDPINDEHLERLKVQFEYWDGVVFGNLLLSDLGALLARIERAEKDRDEARRGVCVALAIIPMRDGTSETSQMVALRLWPSESSRLFPPEVPK